MGTPHRGEVVGKVSSVHSETGQDSHFAFRKGGTGSFVNPQNAVEADVPGIVLRHDSDYQQVEAIRIGTLIKTEDIIHTAPDSAIAIDLFVGARVGVKRNSVVRIKGASEAVVLADPVTRLEDAKWREIQVRQGDLWARFAKPNRKPTVGARTGAMGIKG